MRSNARASDALIFSGNEEQGFVVFPTLHDDVSDIRVQIKDIALRFDYANAPIETLDLHFFTGTFCRAKHPRRPSHAIESWNGHIFTFTQNSHWPRCIAFCLASTASHAQMEVWHIGKGGLSWSSQAETQIGALDVDGLYNLSNWPKARVRENFLFSGQRFLNGQPVDYTKEANPAPGPTMDSSTNSKAPSTYGWGPRHVF